MKSYAEHKNLLIIDHPLVQHKLAHLRDRTTVMVNFRVLLKEIATLMSYEITKELPLKSQMIDTPLASMNAQFIDENVAPTVVSILRAGLGMAEGVLNVVSSARQGHIGLFRDTETHMPIEYLVRLPADNGGTVLLVDPMIATGNSAAHACKVLNNYGIEDTRIKFLALVTAPDGIKLMNKTHPDVMIYAAALDSHLDDNAHIIPGIGDAGDRLFGT